MSVWAVCKDPSGVNTILPVARELRDSGKEVLLLANGKALELLKDKEEFLACFSASDVMDGLFSRSRPEAMVTSMCSKGGVGRDLVPLLREKGIPSVSVQDFWGACVGEGTDGSWFNPIYRPTNICVGDEYAQKLVHASWPDMMVDDIRITGFPAMDKYAAYDVSAMAANARRILSLEGYKIVLFLGECLPGTTSMLRTLISVLDHSGDICLIARKHPRMKNDLPQEIESWEETERMFPKQIGRLISDSSPCELSSLVATADAVISSPLSSTPVDAAFLRRNSIMLFYPAVKDQFMRFLGDQMDEVPVVALGCSRQVANDEELKTALREALHQGLGLTANQEKHFRADGKNARRVADVVLARI